MMSMPPGASRRVRCAAFAAICCAVAPPVPLPDGGKDLYIQQDKFPAQFAADVPVGKARLMAVGQRLIAEAALNEPSSEAPAWKSVPSWFVYGSGDKNIPPAALAFMAERAKSVKTVVVRPRPTEPPEKRASVINATELA